MGDTIMIFLMAIGLMITLLLLIAKVLSDGEKMGYKQGQIDALNGKIKYEKKETDGGEILWTKIKEK